MNKIILAVVLIVIIAAVAVFMLQYQAPQPSEEVTAEDWKEKVYRPDILNNPGKLYKEPGYTM